MSSGIGMHKMGGLKIRDPRAEQEFLSLIVSETLSLLKEEPGLFSDQGSLTDRVQSRLEGLANLSPMAEGDPILVSSVRELLLEVQIALEKGRKVVSADDHARRLLGYQVFNKKVPEKYVYIGLIQAKETSAPWQLRGLNVKAEDISFLMSNPGGRVEIVERLKHV